MRPTSLTAYLAEAHRQELFREAQQAALAAEADPVASYLGTTALLLASDLLLAAGHRLRARHALPPLLHTPVVPCPGSSLPATTFPPCPVVPACRYDGARSSSAACLGA
jgi:hypothetical protein